MQLVNESAKLYLFTPPSTWTCGLMCLSVMAHGALIPQSPWSTTLSNTSRQVSPGRNGVPLPHLGRAFTDVQELKQARVYFMLLSI